MGGGFDKHKPTLAMFILQFTYAGVTLSTRGVLVQGMSPRVFVVYRQAMATLFIAPIAFLTRCRSNEASPMGLKSFSYIFLASLIGVSINQNVYFEGVYLASSSMASATGNLVPAITFVIASFLGLEKVNPRSLRSIAKILGTILCVGGAVVMTLVRGPKLLNALDIPSKSIFGSTEGENWLLGCLFLFGSCCCWSIWLILQVPMSASYPDHLSLSAWMCFISTLQSAVITLFLEPNPQVWKLHSKFELACCVYSGIVASGISFFIQSWCISKRGPLFSAMFNPLCTVIVTILAAIFLHEKLYIGSLAGAAAVVLGLYVVLWGKAEDIAPINENKFPFEAVKSSEVNSSEKPDCKIDLEEPLLSDKTFDNVKESDENPIEV